MKYHNLTEEGWKTLYRWALQRCEPLTITDKGCWEPRLKPRTTGYVATYVNGKTLHLHRLSYIVNVGNIPPKLFVLHKCDNRKCINPDHLYLGTQADNVRDQIERSGSNWPDQSGENHSQHKLTWDKVREIRSSKLSTYTLARIYGMSPSQMSRIKLGQNWKEAS